MSNIEKWKFHVFSSGPYTGDDYVKFQKEAYLDLKEQAEKNGLELYQFNKGHYYFSAVLKNPKNERLIYVSLSDVRDYNGKWYNNVLYRTMVNEKDYSGGQNHYCFWNQIGKSSAKLSV